MATIDDKVLLIPIDLIDQTDRWRKTPEHNIDKLAASIDALGLLHPIVVLPPNGDDKHPLVVGQRRVLACQKLGFDVIEARVAHDMDEADRLLAEHDENVCRERMTPSEAAACFKARKALLEPMAAERKHEGQKAGGRPAKGQVKTSCKIGTKLPARKTRAEAAEGSEYSGETLRKVAKIEEHAANTELPQEVQEFIQTKLDDLNAAEKPKIDPVFRAVERAVAKAVKEAEAAEAEEVAALEAEVPYYGQAAALDGLIKALTKTVPALEEAFVGVDNFDPDVTPEHISEGFKTIRLHVTAINKAAKAIKDLGA